MRQHRGRSGCGVEQVDASVLFSVQRGVNVVQRNLDEGLALFEVALGYPVDI